MSSFVTYTLLWCQRQALTSRRDERLGYFEFYLTIGDLQKAIDERDGINRLNHQIGELTRQCRLAAPEPYQDYIGLPDPTAHLAQQLDYRYWGSVQSLREA